MKKIILTLFIILLTTVLQAQQFNTDVLFQPQYENKSTNKSICKLRYDVNNNGIPSENAVSVGAIGDVSPTGFPAGIFPGQSDAIINVHDPSGTVIRSYTYGFPDEDEEFTAVMPAYNVSSMGFYRVLAVGSKETGVGGDLDMYLGNIRLDYGITICLSSFGFPGTDERAEAIIRVEDMQIPATTTRDFMIIGTTSSIGGGDAKIFAVRIHLGQSCNSIVWSKIYEQTYPAGNPDNIVPKNVVYDSDNFKYTIAGNYTYAGSGNSAVFTMSIDWNGNIITPIKVYTNTAGDEIGTDVTQIGDNYALTYYTENPVGIPPNPLVNSYISLLQLDQDLNILTGNVDFYDNNKWENQGIGLHYNALLLPRFDIGTFHYDDFFQTGKTGFLQLDPSGNPISFKKYDVPASRDARTTAMFKTNNGYYMKASTKDILPTYSNNLGYSLVATDFSGDDGQGCYNATFINRSTTHIKQYDIPTTVTDLMPIRRYYGEAGSMDGIQISCLGVQTAFRKASPSLAAETAKLYPTLLSRSSKLHLEFESAEAQQMKLVVYNTLGQEVYTQSYLAQTGENTLWTASQNLPVGLSIVGLMDQQGKWVLREKVLRQ